MTLNGDIERAREVPITAVWVRLGLAPPPSDGALVRSPWRDDTRPSLQVGGAKNIVHDYGTGETLDGIELVRRVRRCSFREAVEFILGRRACDAEESREPRTGARMLPPHAHPALGVPQRVWDYRDASGELVLRVCRWDGNGGKEIRPLAYLGGSWQWKAPPPPRPLWQLDALARQPDALVLLCEGEKAAEAAQRCFPEMVATCWPGGAGAVEHADFAPLTTRRVVLWPDHDAPGRDAMAKAARRALKAGAASAAIVEVPEAFPPHWDLADDLPEGWTLAQLRELIDAALASPIHHAETGDEASELVEIVLGPDEWRVNDRVIAALAARVHHIYQRAGELVRIVRDATPGDIERPRGAAVIAPLTAAQLREDISRAVRFVRPRARRRGEAFEIAPIPDWCVNAILARGFWPGIRPLVAIAEAPTILPSGEVFARPGYDAASGLLRLDDALDGTLRIAQTPSREDAARAAEELLEVIVDFPFASSAAPAAWLAALLSIVGRAAYDGPAPLVLIDANARGSGKGLLADTLALIALGRAPARMALPDTDDELRKRITALALAGDSVILLDNVARALAYPSLDAALTATHWRDRVLGRSATTAALPLRAIWIATGNNVELGADTARRCLHLRIEPRCERPEERSGFRHQDLRAWVLAERPRLLAAALTILRAYFVAGRPSVAITPLGSYEAWSATIRSAVVWAGVGDPCATRRDLLEVADRETSMLGALLRGLHEADARGRGLTAREIIARAAAEPDDSAFAEAVEHLASSSSGGPSAKSLGRRLHHLRGRVVDGLMLAQANVRREGSGFRWTAIQVADEPRCVFNE